jgi:hypothetical protein
LDIDINAKVYLKKHTIPATVKAAILASLAQFFATKITNVDGTLSDNPLIDFGYYLRTQSGAVTPVGLLAASDIENAIRDTDGVREIGPLPADFTLAATRRSFGLGDFTTQTAARQDIILEAASPLGLPAAANFPRLGTVTLINGDTGAPL